MPIKIIDNKRVKSSLELNIEILYRLGCFLNNCGLIKGKIDNCAIKKPKKTFILFMA
tara:strand:- start:129 stop:299 length:171 start_codon:yes stop_codon:yes gene_type:complete